MTSPTAASTATPDTGWLAALWATEDFRPAFDAGIAAQKGKIAAIGADPAAPTFDNTIAALEASGFALADVGAVFFNFVNTDATPEREAVELDVAPMLARHSNEIFMDDALFRRVDGLFKARGALGLDAEQLRVLERYHSLFVRAGAGLDSAGKARLAAITERLATLGTLFGQNVLADERAYQLVLDGEADLAGLPDFLRASAAEAATARGLPGKYVITLSRSSIEPFLQFSTRRDLRETAFRAWTARGEGGGASDNRAIMAEMVALRAERARLLGHASFAHFRLDDSMAGTPDAAMALLRQVWAPARARAAAEETALQRRLAADGVNDRLAPWDWRHYAERERSARFDINEAELKPYFQLEKMVDAAFDVATRLFGLGFQERPDLPVYHPDVRAFEVTRDGRLVGLFYGDYFARPSKKSGAWMSAFRDQHRLPDLRPGGAGAASPPLILNVMNFAKGAPGEPTLLSLDDARTLFHEFGHGLHGLLSNVTYPLIAGTNVARDFVEFPSQLYEHWLERPEVLRRFALHYRTGEPLPEADLAKLKAARTFNQGFATVEYTSSALVDMELHSRTTSDSRPDVLAAERDVLAALGMPASITMRHRTPHFGHVFSGEGYAAGYYSYLWSEVLDADGFEAFVETGDIFHPETAKRLHDFVYSAGYLRDPAAAYTAFRGRMPTPDALLKKRGLAA